MVPVAAALPLGSGNSAQVFDLAPVDLALREAHPHQDLLRSVVAAVLLLILAAQLYFGWAGGLLPFTLAVFIIGAVPTLTFLLWLRSRGPARRLTVDGAGFRLDYANGQPLVVRWAKKKVRVRIFDERGDPKDCVAGAEGRLEASMIPVAISGAACDAIVESAMDRSELSVLTGARGTTHGRIWMIRNRRAGDAVLPRETVPIT